MVKSDNKCPNFKPLRPDQLTFTAIIKTQENDEFEVLERAYQLAYGKPLPWRRLLFNTQAENEQYLKDKVKEYVVKNTVVLIDGKPIK